MSAPTMDIVYYPADVLARNCEKVTEFGKPLEKLVRRMVPTMYEAIGVGLAANQVGLSKALAVIEYIPSRDEDKDELVPLHAIVNPEILEYGPETDEMEEGCLSCPGIEVNIRRSTWIRVRAQSLDGETFEDTISGFAARIYQHEIDHLNGLLILDRAHGQKALLEAYRANPQSFIDKALAKAHAHNHKHSHVKAI